jgi:hypothetical protein
MRFFQALALATTVAGLSATAQAKTINVPGTTSTIVNGIAAADAPGDIIVVAPGVYNETQWLQFTVSNVTLQAAGVTLHVPPASPSSISIVNNCTGVVIEGLNIERTDATDTWMRAAEMGQYGQATFRDCTFNCPSNGVGIILFDSSDVVVDGCVFNSFANVPWASAVSLENGSGVLGYSDISINNTTCTVNVNKWLGYTGGGTLPRIGNISITNSNFDAARFSHALFLPFDVAYDPAATILIRDCVFQGTLLEVMEFHYTTKGGPQALTMERCRFKKYDSGRKVFWIDIPTTITFDNVSIEGGDHEKLMTIWGGPPAVNFRSCTFAMNGMNGTGDSGIPLSTFIDGWDGGRTFGVTNCIFYCPTEYSPAFQGDAGSTGNRIYAMDHTIVKHGPNANVVGPFVTIAPGVGYSGADPLLTNPAGGDVTLGVGSPAIDAGVLIPGMLLDVVGNSRNQGTNPDIGAYETPGTSAVADWSVY